MSGQYDNDNQPPFNGQVQTNTQNMGRAMAAPGASSGMDLAFQQARLNPRIISQFNQKAIALATIDRDIAASCFYKLKRKKRNPDGTEDSTVIEGPSIRLAEIVAACWGNLWLSSSIKGEDMGSIISEAKVCDMEANNWITTENRRKITGRNGNRFSDDMVIMTANAAAALALRNAVFTAVPRAYVNRILQAAKATAIGSAKSLSERRQEMTSAFSKLGISKERLLGYLERESLDDVTIGDLEDMLGLFTAIRDGDTTIDEAFPEPAKIKPDSATSKPNPAVSVTGTPNTTLAPENSPTATPEVKKEVAENTPNSATEPSPEPGPSPEEIRRGRLQNYNRKYASAKAIIGKDEVANLMEEIGIPKNLFPSRMSEKQIDDGLAALDKIPGINSAPEGDEA